VAWSSVSLPLVVGEHVVATKGGVEFRIASAGSGQWTVTSRIDDALVSATLELTAGVYRYSVSGRRPVDGDDWRALLIAGR
jgi:hypothetical protein